MHNYDESNSNDPAREQQDFITADDLVSNNYIGQTNRIPDTFNALEGEEDEEDPLALYQKRIQEQLGHNMLDSQMT